MLTKKQVEEIKEHLEKAQNPLFFYDNDQDGLCSFLILQKYLGRGKGIAIKTFPELSSEYLRRIRELDSDYIFILDKPVVSSAFWEKIEPLNVPVVWIDHHEIDKKTIPEFVNYYNPIYNEKSTNEPVTALCYQISQKKEDLWLAIAGCIYDRFIPEWYPESKKQFPELTIDSKDAFDVYYKSRIGLISRMFGFALKDRITNVINMQKLLMKAKSPYDILEENNQNKAIYERFNQVNKKYDKFLEKARESAEEYKNLIYFQYGGDMSISADLSNQLMYEFPDKVIIVVYLSGMKANVSGRGKNVKKIVLKAIEGLEGATGGGHDVAVGSKVNTKDLEEFKKRLIDEIEK